MPGMTVDANRPLAVSAQAAAGVSLQPAPTPTKPVYEMRLAVQGIVTSNLQAKVQEWCGALKAANQEILDVRFTSYNGYGAPLSATITHSPKIPVNDEVLKQARRTQVNTPPMFGGPLSGKVATMLNVLTGCDQIIITVRITGTNGYGTPLSADILHVSKAVYDAAMAKSA
jgi:hypothetical protein